MHNLKILYRSGLSGQGCFHCRRYASTRSHYDVLGVKKSASQKEIKSAYIDLSKKHHPDTAGSKSKQVFTDINEAYSVLSKPLTRKEYDNKLAFESAQKTHGNTYGPHNPYYGRPGYPPPPGRGFQQGNQEYGQYYDQHNYRNRQYNPYNEADRKRGSDYSEFRRRYEYFYGKDGKYNRERERQRAARGKDQAAEDRELIRVITICVVLALILTFFRITDLPRLALANRADMSKSPSDAVKREIDRSLRAKHQSEEKDITPPTGRE